MSRTAIHFVLAVVLLFNGPAGSLAWVGSTASEPSADSALQSHCGDSVAGSEAPGQPAGVHHGAGHHGKTSGGCCNPGSCHCGSMSPGALPVMAVSWVPWLLSDVDQGPGDPFVSPTPARHFRPPIV